MDRAIGDALISDSSPIKVLFVDDDEGMHEMMRLLLAKTEFSLASAKSAPEAMQIINTDQPDILITDGLMPGESGFSLIEKMKACARTAKIPVILWTILENLDGSVLDTSGKADFLVNKPFYRSDIMDSLNKATLMIRPGYRSREIISQSL